MARQPRQRSAYGFYHVRQTGGGTRPLFRDDADRAFFLDVLRRAQARYGFLVHAYCLADADEYHLILDANGAEIGNVMKSLNIGYAIHAKADGPLFRDRYRSRPLATREEVLEAVRSIRRPTTDPLAGGCRFDPDGPLALDSIDGDGATCRDCIRSLPEANRILRNLLKERGLHIQEMLDDRSLRNRLIRDFRRETTLSLRQMSLLFDRLSESAISRILRLPDDGLPPVFTREPAGPERSAR